MTQHPRDAPQFFLTTPTACPYLPGRKERKVFTHLVGDNAATMNETLTQGGFRRSQSIAYRPACDVCRACISIRVLVQEFTLSRTFRRVMQKNGDVTARMLMNKATTEQYSTFRAYIDSRHGDGGMAGMSVLDYAMMVEDSHVETRIVEYRLRDEAGDNPLIAMALTDVLEDGLSMVYSFFEPEAEHRSLGTYMILDHIARARALGLPHLYLGYWVEGSPKMDYKARFQPQERLGMLAWERVASSE
jgi:leucyl-tRNA---protein transferase